MVLFPDFNADFYEGNETSVILIRNKCHISVHTGNICSDFQGAWTSRIRLERKNKYFLVWTSHSVNNYSIAEKVWFFAAGWTLQSHNEKSYSILIGDCELIRDLRANSLIWGKRWTCHLDWQLI